MRLCRSDLYVDEQFDAHHLMTDHMSWKINVTRHHELSRYNRNNSNSGMKSDILFVVF